MKAVIFFFLFPKCQIPESFQGKNNNLFLWFPGLAGRRKLNNPSFSEAPCLERGGQPGAIQTQDTAEPSPPSERAGSSIPSAFTSLTPFLGGLAATEKGRSAKSLNVG